MRLHGIDIPEQAIADLCRRHGIARLSLFGSIFGDGFRPDSDVDILVEFIPGRTPGLIRFAGIALEIEHPLGRKVDLRTPVDLSRYFRDEVVRTARVLHAA